MQIFARSALASCVIATLLANAPTAATAQPAICGAPAKIATGNADLAPLTRVHDYRPIFEQCSGTRGHTRLATRAMKVDGATLLLTVDPLTLATSLEHAQC